jgi:RHH-type rel operon transcriptional repressor/antitoxin RelB
LHASRSILANVMSRVMSSSIVLTCIQVSTITSTTLSVRLDPKVKDRLERLAQRTNRSKSFLAAEAIATYVDAEGWQLAEIAAGLAELDRGKMVEHQKVVKWLRSWGKPSESAPPR